MSNTKQQYTDYLRELLVLTRHEVKNYRKLRAAVVGIGIAVLTIAGTCFWGIYGVYKHKSEVIEKAMIIRAAAIATDLVCSQCEHTRIEITLPDGGVVMRDVSQ